MKQYIAPETDVLNYQTQPLCLSMGEEDQIITNPSDGGFSRRKNGWDSELWSSDNDETAE